MTNIEEKYQDFLKLPFPSKLAGEEIFGIDLISLDTFTVGLIDKYITRKGELSKPDVELLNKLSLELNTIIKELNGVERTYFCFLWNLANGTHSELMKQ